MTSTSNGTVMDTSTYLLLAAREHTERRRAATDQVRAARLQRLRRLDRRAQDAACRARLVRLVLS